MRFDSNSAFILSHIEAIGPLLEDAFVIVFHTHEQRIEFAAGVEPSAQQVRQSLLNKWRGYVHQLHGDDRFTVADV